MPIIATQVAALLLSLPCMPRADELHVYPPVDQPCPFMLGICFLRYRSSETQQEASQSSAPTHPAVLRRYFCKRLFGLSGRVRSIRPASSAGCR